MDVVCELVGVVEADVVGVGVGLVVCEVDCEVDCEVV